LLLISRKVFINNKKEFKIMKEMNEPLLTFLKIKKALNNL
jgi:hypothetical protein